MGFLAAVSDAAATVTKLDFNGQYRTVIRFITMPERDVPNVNFTALRAGDKLASLPRTGQSISYLSGDDKSVQADVTWPDARYIDNLTAPSLTI